MVSLSPGDCGHVPVAMTATASSFQNAEPGTIFQITCRDISSFCPRGMMIRLMLQKPTHYYYSSQVAVKFTMVCSICNPMVRQIRVGVLGGYSVLSVLSPLFPQSAGTTEAICQGFPRKRQVSPITTIQVPGRVLL